ncbi:Uma2 family endonuclease [Cyanobacteria bacterium FACHB-DQ100]|uniref:Uma2 family endonuclease n=1 Tax=Leptolyngbya sp. DQ-M1 TaxID=2933920 RepID=UPI0019ABD050|nr:Uma2 family endonuclease [Cyanobacteria bacterium FACHB-DQ100]
MTQAKVKFSSFEEYLSYDDGTDQLYELWNGELVALPPESGLNFQIATFLLLQLVPFIDYRRIRGHGLELQVRGEPQNRFPDLTVLREEHIEQLKRRNTILLSMAPPLLVVEIVSPGETNRSRDYTNKREQYEDRGIPEYWIVDPQTQSVTVLQLEAGAYQEIGAFQGDQVISSSTFPMLNLTPAQIFSA